VTQLADGQSVVWTSDHEFSAFGTEFEVAELRSPRSDRRPGARPRLAIHKSREHVEAFIDLVMAFPSSRIVEIGIKAGGSTALLAQLGHPSRLVAIDITPTAASGLEAFLDIQGLRETVHPYYGVDQSDQHRLTSIVAHEFGGAAIDLVIDDASHLLRPTRASFSVLFPRLRPEGLFVIEDWSWEHAIADKLVSALSSDVPSQHLEVHELLQLFETLGVSPEMLAPLGSGELLSDLLAELIVGKADGDVAIGDITIRPFATEVRRGPNTAGEDELGRVLQAVGPRRILHVGRPNLDVLRQISRSGGGELVVMSREPPGEHGPGPPVTHVSLAAPPALSSEAVRRLCDAPFDAVIDGLSPDGEQARDLASALLPCVRPGGAYLIRGWPRLVAPRSVAEPEASRRRTPRLFLELILGVAEWHDAIEELRLGDDWLTVRPGPRASRVEVFDVGDLYRDHFRSLSRA
jgi:predicted O-methyltransferase YrrM